MRLSLKTIAVMAVFASLIGAFSINCRHSGTAVSNDDLISYNFHVRPILSDKCFACHGPDVKKRQGGFRLDIPDSSFAPLKETKDAFALISGKLE